MIHEVNYFLTQKTRGLGSVESKLAGFGRLRDFEDCASGIIPINPWMGDIGYRGRGCVILLSLESERKGKE